MPARADQAIEVPAKISEYLHAIPAGESDLATRLADIGVTVNAVIVHRLTHEDVAEDPTRLAPGDTEISILTSGDADVPGCQLLGQPTFIRRGHRYLPRDRTGVWLVTGRCALPD